MDQNRILTVGFSIKGLRGCSLTNPPNFNEFDVAIWSPAETYEQLKQHHFGVASVTSIINNKKKMMDWVARGHSLLVIAQWLENFRYGPISSNQTVFNWSEEDPFVGISFEKESGELIDFSGPQKLEGLFKPILQAFRYTVIFSSDSIIPLLCVSKSRHGSDQIVGGVIEF